VTVDVEAEGRHAAFHRGRPYRSTFSGSPRGIARRARARGRAWRPSRAMRRSRRPRRSREQLVLARPELEAVADGIVRGRAHLVRPPRLEQLALAERQAHVRPEVLVRRADEHVDVPGGHVDRPVRRVVDRIGPGERAGECASSTMRRTSGAVPTELAATGNPTTRVRSESCASRSS
jgi:hypothetical protein